MQPAFVPALAVTRESQREVKESAAENAPGLASGSQIKTKEYNKNLPEPERTTKIDNAAAGGQVKVEVKCDSDDNSDNCSKTHESEVEMREARKMEDHLMIAELLP